MIASDPSNILSRFKSIEPSAYLEKVRFYEKHCSYIQSLSKDEYHFIKYEYVNALFSLGRYQEMLNQVDKLIEYVFMHDISINGKNAFEQLLYIKSASLINLNHYDPAIDLSRQLNSIHPGKTQYEKLLLTSMRGKYLNHFMKFRITIIVSILISSAFFFGTWCSKTAELNMLTPVFIKGAFGSLSAVILIFTCCLLYAYLKSRAMARKVFEEIGKKKTYLTAGHNDINTL